MRVFFIMRLKASGGRCAKTKQSSICRQNLNVVEWRLKLSCHFPFTHEENAWILRTIGIYLHVVWVNPRFISSNQGKNAMLCIAFSIGKFLFKLKMQCVKKVETACVNGP